MRFLSVCSGIEAASVAWNPLGWKAVAFSEIEPFPCAVLAHHYPDTPNWGDMTKYKEWPDVAIDLLCGGTPCQSFSVAGLRKGLDDPRGNLMLTFGAIAAKYRPKWLVWENVPGVLSSNGGRDFGTFLGMLGQLGYGFAYRVLDAYYFGCACSRPRVFVVGHYGDWRKCAAVLFERASFTGNQPEKTETSPVFTATGGMAQDDRTPCILDDLGPRIATPKEWERALGFPDDYTKIPTQTRRKRSGNKAQMESESTIWDHSGRLRRDASEAERSVRSMRRDYGAPSSGSLPPDREGAGDSVPPLQHQASGNRGYGPGNAGMGLPGRRRIADGPRYKALGNSWAVPVARWIGERIDRVNSILEAA